MIIFNRETEPTDRPDCFFPNSVGFVCITVVVGFDFRDFPEFSSVSA